MTRNVIGLDLARCKGSSSCRSGRGGCWAAALLLLAVLLSLQPFAAHGADRFWVASSPGNWGDASNWSTTSGGSGGASVPGTADIARFDGLGQGGCTLNLPVQVLGMVIAGYSGTIAQGAGNPLTVGSGGYQQSSGLFQGGDRSINIAGSFTVTGGRFVNTTCAAESPVAGLSCDVFTGTDLNTFVGRFSDATVNFSPADTLLGINRAGQGDNFSCRWTGQVRADVSGEYAFHVTNDDGSRLFVDNQPLVSAWFPQGPTEYTGKIQLLAGRWYNLRLDFFELSGGSVIQLRYTPPAGAKQIIPASNLRASNRMLTIAGTATVGAAGVVDLNGADTDLGGTLNNAGLVRVVGSERVTALMPNSAGTVEHYGNGTYGRLPLGRSYFNLLFNGSGTWQQDDYLTVRGTTNLASGTLRLAPTTGIRGLLGEFYQGQNFNSLKSVILDPVVDFNPADFVLGLGRAGVADSFSARWTGQVLANFSESYTFRTYTDDGVRLWVNNTLIIDSWVPQSPTSRTGTLSLTAGQWYDLKLEFFEGSGGSVVQLFYSSASEASKIIPQSNLRPASGAIDFQGPFSIGASGILDLNGADANLKGTYSNNGQLILQGAEKVSLTMDTDSGTTVYTGAGNYPTLAAGNSYYNLTLNGSGSWRHTAPLDVNGTLLLQQGTLDSNGQNLLLAGDFNRLNTGTYLPGTNTLILDGGNQRILNSTVFHGLQKHVTAAATLTFQNGTRQTLNGPLSLQGAAGNLLSLRSDLPGTQWHLIPNGTRAAQFVDVQDGVNRIAPKIGPASSVDSGNTILWFQDLQPVGAAPTAVAQDSQGTLWNLFANASGGLPPYSFVWRDAANQVISNSANPTGIAPPANGASVYTVTVTDDLGSIGAASVTIFRAASALVASANAVPAFLQSGGSTDLSASASGGSGAGYSFNWSGPGGFVFAGQNPGKVTPPPGANVYAVTVRDSWGLTATAQVTVTVYGPLTPNPAANPAQIAPGGSTTLSSNPSGGSGSYVFFEWRGPGGEVLSKLQNPGQIFPPNEGLNTYTLLVRDSLGFSGTASVDVVTVGSALGVTATVSTNFGGNVLSGASVSVLSGGSVQLSSQGSGGSLQYAFAWSGPNGFSSAVQNPGAIPVPGPGVYTYTVTLTDLLLGGSVSDSVSVVVIKSLDAQGLFVKEGWVKYGRFSRSSAETPLDWFRLTVLGVDLQPGDGLALSINGLPIGDLAQDSGLILDGKGRASGQLGADYGSYFKNCRIRFNAKKRRLQISARSGVFSKASASVVMAQSGSSGLTPVLIFLDHTPADGLIDGALSLPVVFNVKVSASGESGVTERGKTVRPGTP